jgi:hypothetical protein
MHAKLLDRVATVSGLGDQRHIRLNPNETGDPFAHEWTVIDVRIRIGRVAGAHDASPRVRAGIAEANSRDSQECFVDVA